MPGKDATWPGGKRVAVLVSILFESWSEGRSPSYFPRTTPLKAGTTDRGGIQWAELGANEGIWRILRTLERHKVPATVLASGVCGERYPEALAAAGQAGHDIAGHGWTQDALHVYMTPEEERDAIRRTCVALKKASGVPTKGWATPAYSWTGHTFDILLEEGVEWYADALDISLPRREKTAKGEIVAFPWSDFVDNRVLRGAPSTFFDVYKDSFDYLREHEPMGLVHIGFHSHFGGRPLMAAQFDKLLAYLKFHTDVWWPGHNEMAKFVRTLEPDALRYRQRFFGA